MTIQQENSRAARVKSEPRQLTDKQRILFCLEKLTETLPLEKGFNAISIVGISEILSERYLLTRPAVGRRMIDLVRLNLVKCVGSKDGFSLYALV